MSPIDYHSNARRMMVTRMIISMKRIICFAVPGGKVIGFTNLVRGPLDALFLLVRLLPFKR